MDLNDICKTREMVMIKKKEKKSSDYKIIKFQKKHLKEIKTLYKITICIAFAFYLIHKMIIMNII